MPKIRTRRSAAKRIKVTGSGRIKRMREFSGCHHIRQKKSPKRVRKFRKPVIIDASDEKRLRLLAPYKF
ncbi:MAG: 50S ribosomal protein L35 [Armatimonadetes bacterium]|nr:50S ribosomal protein L35 [Armatimonadota bacterium]